MDRPLLTKEQKIMSLPENIREVLRQFSEDAKAAFGEKLRGVYLHGSAVMGCYNPEKSDLDLLVAVDEEPEDPKKLQFMAQVLALSSKVSKKGIEMSVVPVSACRPFQYPTPFFLHFSEAHRAWFQKDPGDYVRKMKGTDPDLAAHFTILWHYGICLFGAPVYEVFELPDSKSYLDSIMQDIVDAPENIREDPVYFALNLLRVLAYREENLILSKKQAGEWALKKPELSEGAPQIRAALQAYSEEAEDRALLPEKDPETFAGSLLDRIKKTEMTSRRSWQLTEEGVAVCLEDRVLRVRSDDELFRVLKRGRASGREFSETLRRIYRERRGQELAISARSLYAEIRLHAFSDRVFCAFSALFTKLHLKPLQKLFDRLHVHAFQIDCGERSVDRNRIVFDLLSGIFG